MRWGHTEPLLKPVIEGKKGGRLAIVRRGAVCGIAGLDAQLLFATEGPVFIDEMRAGDRKIDVLQTGSGILAYVT
jgi:hypothetical protein